MKGVTWSMNTLYSARRHHPCLHTCPIHTHRFRWKTWFFDWIGKIPSMTPSNGRKQFGRSKFTLLPGVFKSLIQNLKVKSSVKSSRTDAYKNTRVFSHERKTTREQLFKACTLWTKASRTHWNIKVARMTQRKG